jgi:phosphopantothenoylcysteine decarboxylase/phosphopantothenate--cysteine ligase
MDLDMYQHPSTQKNIKRFKDFGNQVIDARFGELASGLVGSGRMAEPEEIVDILQAHFSKGLPLSGKHALVTAGPTFEEIDPVRFIGNHSSGKMGFALAEQLSKLGADVTLISGPTSQQIENTQIELIKVKDAKGMFEAVSEVFPNTEIAIFAAAVADFTPVERSDSKIKKSEETQRLLLKATKDIALEMGKIKKANQMTVGFALETNDEETNALSKLTKKNFDFIVLNSLNDEGAGFAHDTNRITIIDRNNNLTKFELKSKMDVAHDIVQHIIDHKNN